MQANSHFRLSGNTMAKKKRKPAPPETGMERLKKLPLWQWGLIVIVSGLVAGVVMGEMGPSGGSSAARRGAAIGRGVAMAFFVLIGVGLIIAHFVRGRKK